jgi:hypothetical protein
VAEVLQVELFASEPLIGNPTNIDMDARGRVWMCEAFNYRPQLNSDNPNRAEGDRIVILEDKWRRQSRYIKGVLPGNRLNAALGIVVLGNEVIVSCSPNELIFTNTNGDGKPDNWIRRRQYHGKIGGADCCVQLLTAPIPTLPRRP